MAGINNYPYVNSEDYNEYKGNSNELKRLNDRGKTKCEKKFKSYTLSANINKKAPKKRLPTIRVAFVGKTGHGKSSTANTLIGSQQFKEGASTKSQTVSSSIKTCPMVGGRKLTVMDSPGMEDTHRDEKEVLDEVFRVGFLLREGVDCFIYCINAMSHRFTKEDERVLSTLKSKFGKRFTNYCLIVYTNIESKLRDIKNLDELCLKQREHQGVDSLLEKIGWKVVAVDNSSTIPSEKTRNQRVLIDMIDWVVESNNYIPYTNIVCQKAQMLFRGLNQRAEKEGWHPSLLVAVIECVTSSTSANFSDATEFIKVVKAVINDSNLGKVTNSEVKLHGENQNKTMKISAFEDTLKAIYFELRNLLQFVRVQLIASFVVDDKMPVHMAVVFGTVLWATLVCGTPDDDLEDDSD